MTRARSEAGPESVRLAVAGGNARVQHRGFHRLEETELLGAPQAARIHRDQHVGGAALALVADALDERVFARLDAVDLDAGGLGEVA
jgi:hypothetical protein